MTWHKITDPNPDPEPSPTGSTFEIAPGDKVPFTTDHLLAHMQIEADFVVERGVVTRGQRIVIRDLLQKAHDEIIRLRDEASDCPICPMVATDRDDALNDFQSLAESYDALVANSSAEHQRMSDLLQALSANVTRLDEEKEQDRHTIEYWKGQFERREDDYARLYAQAEDIKEQYRDCASELAAARRHLAHLQEACDAWMNGVADVVEPLGFDRHAASGPADLLPGLVDLVATWRLTGQVIYLEQQRWQEMAEDLWEELQEWHAENCGQADDGTPIGAPCTCHRILAAKWDEITHADDWADDGEVES